MRHSDINVDLVTWSRLLSRAAPAITAGDTSSPYGAKSTQTASSNLKPTALNFDSDSSPPQSESQSGENSPKTPETPRSPREPPSPIFSKGDATSGLPQRNSLIQNGELPPVEPVSDAELMHTPDQIILPPPPQFQLVTDSQNSSKHRASSSPPVDSINFSFPSSKGTPPAEKGDHTSSTPSPLHLRMHAKEGEVAQKREVRYSDLFPNGTDFTVEPSQVTKRPPSPLPELVMHVYIIDLYMYM